MNFGGLPTRRHFFRDSEISLVFFYSLLKEIRMAILKFGFEKCFRLKLLGDHFSIEFHNDFLFRWQNAPEIFNWPKLSISGL